MRNRVTSSETRTEPVKRVGRAVHVLGVGRHIGQFTLHRAVLGKREGVELELDRLAGLHQSHVLVGDADFRCERAIRQ